MGPAMLFASIILIFVAVVGFTKNYLFKRQMMKEFEGFIAEIDSKLSRLEQKEQLGERYERIRDTLKRHRSTISE